MTTYDLQALGVAAGGTTGIPKKGSGLNLAETFFNMADSDLNSGNGVGINDILQVIDIPAETVIMTAGIEVLTVSTDGSSPTFDLGWTATSGNPSTDVNFYVAAQDPLTLGHMSQATTAFTHGLQFFSAADTLDIKVLTAVMTDGIYRVWALFADVNTRLGNVASWTA